MDEFEDSKTKFKYENTETHKIENSDVIKHALFSLINVATPKTSDDYAWSTLKKLLKELIDNYDFLKYIQIGELGSLNNNIGDITALSEINAIEPKEVGRAIQDLIDLYKKYLGKKAGYFFITEFKDDLGSRYHSIIKSMGVDLRLIELQNELYGLDSSKYKIRDDGSANIAYIKKEWAKNVY